ncbi:MAG: type VI secretion system tip protein VgrG, partial [Gemmatimonadetes bacterium]
MTPAGFDPFSLHWPQAPGGSSVRSIEGHEAISRPFRYEVAVNVPNPGRLSLDGLVDSACAVGINLASGETRWVNGIATEVEAVGFGPDGCDLRVVLEPTLALLRRSSHCRIFQDKSTADILKAVIEAQAIDLKTMPSEATTWPYRVQYNETDLDFVERLAADEGWSYYWLHSRTKHELVFHDGGGGALPRCPGPAAISAVPSPSSMQQEDVIERFTVARRGATDAIALVTPDPALADVRRDTAGSGPVTREECWWPVVSVPKGAAPAKGRLKAARAVASSVRVEGALRGLVAGHCVRVEGLPPGAALKKEDSDGCVVDLHLHATVHEASVVAHLVPSDAALPPPVAPRAPHMAGAQLALVSGKEPDTVWADDLGRVMVRFPWDSSGSKPEACTCWIPVMQGLSGADWGTHYMPRVGQTAVVTFLDGDPDQPIVVGTLHCAPRTPPAFDAPERFGMRSKVGGPKSLASEFTILDRKPTRGDEEGSEGEDGPAEQVFLQAQADLMVNVARDWSSTVEGKLSSTVTTGDVDLEVKQGALTANIAQGALTLTVGGQHSIESKGGVTHKVTGDAVLNVSGALKIAVDGPVTIEGKDSVTIEGKKGVTIKGGPVEISGSKVDVDSKGAVDISATGNLSQKATENITAEATLGLTNKAGTSLTNQAGT